MTEREHIPSADCWCTPYIVQFGGPPVVTTAAGRIVLVESIDLASGKWAIHVESPETA